MSCSLPREGLLVRQACQHMMLHRVRSPPQNLIVEQMNHPIYFIIPQSKNIVKQRKSKNCKSDNVGKNAEDVVLQNQFVELYEEVQI